MSQYDDENFFPKVTYSAHIEDCYMGMTDNINFQIPVVLLGLKAYQRAIEMRGIHIRRTIQEEEKEFKTMLEEIEVALTQIAEVKIHSKFTNIPLMLTDKTAILKMQDELEEDHEWSCRAGYERETAMARVDAYFEATHSLDNAIHNEKYNSQQQNSGAEKNADVKKDARAKERGDMEICARLVATQMEGLTQGLNNVITCLPPILSDTIEEEKLKSWRGGLLSVWVSIGHASQQLSNMQKFFGINKEENKDEN